MNRPRIQSGRTPACARPSLRRLPGLARLRTRDALRCALPLALPLLAAACDDPVDTDWFADAPATFSEVAAGDQHTCALDSEGRAWCFGRSLMARLGYFSRAEPCDEYTCMEPVPVEGGARYDDLEAGSTHNCTLDGDEMYCWGFAWWGQLGDARSVYQRCPSTEGETPLPCSLDPVPVAIGFPISEIGVGAGHSCAVTASGEAYCWGLNQFGQGGNTTGLDTVIVPAPVQGGHDFVAIAAGTSHTCAIDRDAAMWCWGANIEGRLGDSTLVSSAAPVRVAGAFTWRALDLGAAHTCGITTNDRAYCWGLGGRGRVGEGLGLSWHFPVPVAFPVPTDVAEISAGDTHTCLVTRVGELYCFGENDHGQLGDGSGRDQLIPSLVEHPLPWRSVSAGERHTCAIDVVDQLFCWGANEWGQLGTGALGDRALPTRVRG